jgi:hypothetical protein
VLSVYIGYDPMESVAYYTLAHSLQRRCSVPLSIAPVARAQLTSVYRRERGPTESTDFSLTRFLVPWLSGFAGWSIYMDCDMLCRADLAELASEMKRQPDKGVLVCKHDYTPRTARKFLDRVQTTYPRKNWSSLMLFNNERCRALTPEYVNSASPTDLHRFAWMDDRLIGELPLEWNWLVGEYAYNASAKMLHFTLGGPYFDAYRHCDYAEEWFAERESMQHVEVSPIRRSK